MLILTRGIGQKVSFFIPEIGPDEEPLDNRVELVFLDNQVNQAARFGIIADHRVRIVRNELMERRGR